MTTSQDGYDLILSLIHEFTKTQAQPHTLDSFTLFLLRRKVYDLQQQREVIRHKILSEVDDFSKQKEVKK